MMQVVEVPPIPPLPQAPHVPTGMPEEAIVAIVLITVTAVIGAVWMFTPLIKAWARRIEGKGADPELRQDVDDVRREMEGLRHELLETQERLDFAERLLSQRREAERLPAPGPTDR